MNLLCDAVLGSAKKSGLQRTRVITESWFAAEGYCLNCNSPRLDTTVAGTVARDFVCPVCNEPYELKSAATAHTNIVQDGGFYAMMGRLYVKEAPTLMLLHYSPQWSVQGLVAVSSVFLTPEVVRRRAKPHTRKSGAGYLMCDLDLSRIPPDGKIVLVDNGKARPVAKARSAFRASKRFDEIPIEQRGWPALVLAAMRRIGKPEFSLAEVYAHEEAMHAAYPENSHVRAKIRQQIQVLRDLGYVEFLSKRGEYRMLL